MENKEIPKVIHYCWFGRKPLPKSAIKCIDSWKKFLPDYTIKEWNEDNFDIEMIPYTKEAYEAKKYAFVSDFARFWILYRYGGLYFDTDVEVIKSFDEIVDKGAFMGCEADGDNTQDYSIAVAPGLGLGVYPGNSLYKEFIELYSKENFRNQDGSLNLRTVVVYTTDLLKTKGLKNTNQIQNCDDIWIYPSTFFCPISTADGKMRITSETVSIHHYAQSWQSPVRKYARKIVLALGGEKLKQSVKRIFFNK